MPLLFSNSYCSSYSYCSGLGGPGPNNLLKETKIWHFGTFLFSAVWRWTSLCDYRWSTLKGTRETVNLGSGQLEGFCKKAVPKNFVKFTGKDLCENFLFSKAARLQRTILLKKGLQNRGLSSEFYKTFINTFLIEGFQPTASKLSTVPAADSLVCCGSIRILKKWNLQGIPTIYQGFWINFFFKIFVFRGYWSICSPLLWNLNIGFL